MQIHVTEPARERLLESGLNEGNFLRLGVQPGGCAGLSYAAFVDTEMTDADQVIFEQEPLRIVAEREYLELLDGLNVDYSDDLIQPGFVLRNPNTRKSCGCGASFKQHEEDAVQSCGGGCR